MTFVERERETRRKIFENFISRNDKSKKKLNLKKNPNQNSNVNHTNTRRRWKKIEQRILAC